MFEGLVKWVDDGEAENAVSMLLDRLSPGKRPRTKTVPLLTQSNCVTVSNGLTDRTVTAGDFEYSMAASGRSGYSSRLLLYDRHGTGICTQVADGSADQRHSWNHSQLMIKTLRDRLLPMTARTSRRSWHSRQLSRFVRIL